MKVLITGGYGFIGSHAVERFHKEGYEVYIIDNLSSGDKNNVQINHKFYCLDLIDRRCEEVFANANFDVVVHLAAHIDAAASVEKTYFDAESNILGLIKMLELSRKYDVKKFIFASSAAVYGNNQQIPLTEEDFCSPLSPYGVSKLTGEEYCKLWKKIHGLETISLRFSNVYGPRQSIKGEGGVMATFMNRLLNGKELTIYGTGEQTRDFIYVEDVVDAIYRAVDFCRSEVLNVSVNKQYRVSDLVDGIKGVHGEVTVKYEPPRKGDILHSRLSNKKAIDELNWSPLYDLEQGITKTYEWYKRYDKENTKVTGRRKRHKVKPVKKNNFKIFLPYIENLLAFIMVIFLSRYATSHAIDIMIDLKLAYIIVIGIVYGSAQASLAVVLSCLLFIWEAKDLGHDLISLIYNINTLIHFTLYIFVGAVLGYTTDSRKIEIENKEEEIREIEEKFDFLYEMHNESKLVRKELQNQILNAEDSFGKIYNIISRLDALEPEKVFSETVGAIEEIMKGKDVYIFSMSKGQQYLRLISKSKDSNISVPKSIKVSEYFEIEKLISSKNIFVNKDFKESLPMMMAPIILKDQVIAIICIYTIEFQSMSLYKQNLLKIVTNLITSSLARAYQYDQAIHNKKYIDETWVLNNEYFEKLLQNKIDAKKKNHTDFILLKIWDEQWQQELTWEKIGKVIRESDYMGVNKKNELFILASNTRKEEAPYVIKRFNSINIHAEIVGEHEYDDTAYGGPFSA